MSALYRKKPLPVEARQLLGSSDGQAGRDLADWCGGSVGGLFAEPKVLVPTLEGDLMARAGDWIVKGPRGEFWPVKASIFAETYEDADTPLHQTTDARAAIHAMFQLDEAATAELDQRLDEHRVEVFAEAIAALQGLLDLAPNGRRAHQLAFSVGALMGARDFPGEVPSNGGVAVNKFTDLVYRDAYATGRTHAGASGWLFDQFEAVITTSNGDYGTAEEYRCRKCGAIGAQGVGVKSLLDLMAMAARHECLPRLTDTTKDSA